VALATMFKSGTRDLLQRLRTKAWESPDEKHALLAELEGSDGVKLPDAVSFLFSPDGEMRQAAGRRLAARKDAETVRAVVSALKGRPEPARRAALAVLASLPLPDVAGQLGTLAVEAPGEQRRLATEALLEMPLSQQTVPHLTRIIEQGEAAHRLRAVQRFAEIANDKNVPFFQRLLDDGDDRLRLAAWQVVVRFAGPAQLPLMISKVGEEPYGTQQVLVAAIQALAPKAGADVVEQVLRLLSSGNTALRTAAFKILLALPDRVAVVRRFITYSRELQGWVRDRALESMREFGPEVLEPALELIGDPEPDVRSTALTLVAGFDDPRVGQAAMRCLGDEDWWIAIHAADLVGRIGGEQAVPALVQAAAREDVRWAAVEALGRIGGEQALQALAGQTRDPRPEIRIEALAALALSEDPRVLPVLQQATQRDPVKWVRVRACDLATRLAEKGKVAVDPAALREALATTSVAAGAPEAHRLLALARQQGASDLHVSVDAVPVLRISGRLVRLQGEPLTAERTAALLHPLLDPGQREQLERCRQLDACFHVENDGRYRANLFLDRKGLNGVFRVIPEQPPTITELGLPAQVADIAQVHQGIVLVTGPAGCGKSTTLAALVNLVNETRRSHVLSLEDPVEFVHPFKSSLINQREVGRHTASFAAALRAALREDPDVIVIGEMRDAETVTLALTAAETGHVVLATLNANTAAKAVDRVITAFPADEQPQVRESFADSLKLVVSQALLPTADGKGRVACFEILWGTRPIASLIRDNKTFQIPSLMQIGQTHGMRTFDDSLLHLVRAGKISPEAAYMRAVSKDVFEPLVPPKFLEQLLA